MMTEKEKAEFKSFVVLYLVPFACIVDIGIIIAAIYGSLSGFSYPVMVVLTTLAFIGFHGSYRMVVAKIVSYFRPKFNLDNKIYRVDEDEIPFYDFFKVKLWKDVVPAWNKTNFMLSIKDIKDIDKVSKVLRFNLSAEITHHVNFYLSLFGTLFCLCKGMQPWWWSFGIVSLLLGVFGDLPFIMIQRYNRFRVYPIYKRLQERASKEEIQTK